MEDNIFFPSPKNGASITCAGGRHAKEELCGVPRSEGGSRSAAGHGGGSSQACCPEGATLAGLVPGDHPGGGGGVLPALHRHRAPHPGVAGSIPDHHLLTSNMFFLSHDLLVREGNVAYAACPMSIYPESRKACACLFLLVQKRISGYISIAWSRKGGRQVAWLSGRAPSVPGPRTLVQTQIRFEVSSLMFLCRFPLYLRNSPNSRVVRIPSRALPRDVRQHRWRRTRSIIHPH